MGFKELSNSLKVIQLVSQKYVRWSLSNLKVVAHIIRSWNMNKKVLPIQDSQVDACYNLRVIIYSILTWWQGIMHL